MNFLRDNADFIFSAGSICFIIALIPMVLSEHKPPWHTSLLTGFWLGVFALLYASLDLWYSCITTGITSALWLTVMVQKLRSPSA